MYTTKLQGSVQETMQCIQPNYKVVCKRPCNVYNQITRWCAGNRAMQ